MKQKNIIMMAVAVGFGLVAALLTSQMSAKSTVETVEVMVAAKDLPVGTLLTKEDVTNTKVIKWKKIPKDLVPPGIVETTDELVDKRLSRAIRAEETINRADITKGGVVTIPPGMKMATVQLAAHQAVAGFVGPGSRVDVLATVRLAMESGGQGVIALPILVDMLVLAVNTETTYSKEGVYPQVNTVSFAVTQKQALLIKLAQARSADMSLLLRNPEDPNTKLDSSYNIDEVINLLRNERNPANVVVTDDGIIERRESSPEVKPETPKIELVKVPYALVDIAPGTELTNDLISDPKVFGVREMPSQYAEDAVLDLTEHLTKVLKNGLGKGQWVTKSLVGDVSAKPSPQDAFNPSKGGPNAPLSLAKRKTHDIQIHTARGTQTFRYVEVEPGEWKLWGEVKPGQEQPALEEPAPKKQPEPKAD